MTAGEWISIGGIVLTLTSGIILLIFQAGILHGKLTATLKSIEDIQKDIKPISRKIWILWRARTTINRSPMVLNNHGKEILRESNIKSFTDKHYNEILRSVKKLNPTNSWEVQEYLIDVVQNLNEKESCRIELQESMSALCSDIETILFVAAVNMRDIVIEELHFRREDIDKNDPLKSQKLNS